jgi:uncharacterized protein (DUF362 family)
MEQRKMTTVSVPFANYATSVAEALDRIGAAAVFAQQDRILIKPNLINADPHPVTTPAACSEALVRYIRSCSQARIVIAEGCGVPEMTTHEIFDQLGYTALARRWDLDLVDLNTAPLQTVSNPDGVRYKAMVLPEMASTHYLVSVPVLKAHSLADLTGAMKNMMGLLPPDHYGRGGAWRKAAFHEDLHQSIQDLNRCRPPDLSLMDASLGLATFHLGGPPCNPPAARIIAGYDARAVDRMAAGLLGLDWRRVPHLVDATAVTKARSPA